MAARRRRAMTAAADDPSTGDNVAIVANDGGLPAGTVLARPRARRPGAAGHKVALADIAAGEPVLRYGVVIGRAAKAIPAGSWVHERLLEMPAARRSKAADGHQPAAPQPPLEGYTFEGYRNADGSVGTRNLLGITTTVRCSRRRGRRRRAAHPPRTAAAVPERRRRRRPRARLRMRRRDRRRAPRSLIRTLRNISLEPELRRRADGREPGLREVAAERPLPPAASPLPRDTGGDDGAALDGYCLQDDAHVGFMSMIDSIVGQARRTSSG